MLYIGIDPGEAHCGFAALEITSDNVVRVEARTYDVTARHGYLAMVQTIVDLLPHARRAQIVCEDFRIRKAGHQRFSHGDTLRMIGALEYGVQSVESFAFFLVPPSDPKLEELRELYGPVLTRYRRQWPRYHHPAWHHCLSAWRVLGHHLFKTDPSIIQLLQQLKKSKECVQWLPASALRDDHIADAAEWL